MKNQEILKERAKTLAKPLEQEEFKGDYLEILVFKLASERYGIETEFAREVYPLKDYTYLPCAPPFIFGLINVRRKILTIIDLKVLFSMPSSSNEESKIVILKQGDHEFGILSDGFEGIQRILVNKIQPTLPTLTGIRAELLKGVTLEGIVILDGKKLLSSKQIIVDQMVEI